MQPRLSEACQEPPQPRPVLQLLQLAQGRMFKSTVARFLHCWYDLSLDLSKPYVICHEIHHIIETHILYPCVNPANIRIL